MVVCRWEPCLFRIVNGIVMLLSDMCHLSSIVSRLSPSFVLLSATVLFGPRRNGSDGDSQRQRERRSLAVMGSSKQSSTFSKSIQPRSRYSAPGARRPPHLLFVLLLRILDGQWTVVWKPWKAPFPQIHSRQSTTHRTGRPAAAHGAAHLGAEAHLHLHLNLHGSRGGGAVLHPSKEQ